MLAKFLKSFQHQQITMRTGENQLRHEQWQAERHQQCQHAFRTGAIEVTAAPRINCVQSKAYSNGFSVPKLETGRLLHFVSSPVTEVQGACRPKFERIATPGNMGRVQFSATANQVTHCFRFQRLETRRVTFESLEKRAIANTSHLDCFNVASAFIARGECR